MSESLWNRCLRVLESELPEQQFNTWVRPLQAIERDGELKLLAPNRYVIEWLGQNSLPRIKELIRAFAEDPAPEVVLDVDATDDPLYGNQEGKYFHGYYAEYCYLPLYIFSGEHLLCARLRQANEDPASGVRQELERIVKKLKAAWPEVRIILRGDSGFCRDEIMS